MPTPLCRCRTCREAGTAGPRLEPVLMRLPVPIASALRDLARRTRIPKADYEREAIADLLRKYGALPEAAEGDKR